MILDTTSQFPFYTTAVPIFLLYPKRWWTVSPARHRLCRALSRLGSQSGFLYFESASVRSALTLREYVTSTLSVRAPTAAAGLSLSVHFVFHALSLSTYAVWRSAHRRLVRAWRYRRMAFTRWSTTPFTQRNLDLAGSRVPAWRCSL